MKDFKSFTAGNGDERSNSSGNAAPGEGSVHSADFQSDKGVNLIKTVAQSMQGKSRRDIFRAVIDEAERGKRAGTLTNADLDNFYSLISPTLDGFKRKKLKSIIERLKRI